MQVAVDKPKGEKRDSLRITVTITGEVPFSGLLKIQMPWHLTITERESAQRQGGQIVEIPVFHNVTTLNASARFRGTGAIQIELSGMYSGVVAQVRSLPVVVG